MVVDVDKGNLELIINFKFCLEDNLCVYELVLFDKKVIFKLGCNWDLFYLDLSELLIYRINKFEFYILVFV